MPSPGRPTGKKPRGGQTRRDSRSKAQIREDAARAKFVNKHKDLLDKSDMANGATPPPPGPFFYEDQGKTFLSMPSKMLQNIMTCPHYAQMMKDCQAEGVPVPHHLLTKDPQAHLMSPQQYLSKVQDNQIPRMNNHHVMEELASKTNQLPPSQRPEIMLLEFRDFQRSTASPNPGFTKTETVDTGAQTDDTEHFYVSKDNILAYTIAVVQNTQAYHFGQMSVVFQTAQNKAALETPSRAEEFINEHFNIKLLTDKENYTGPPNAQAHKRKASMDTTPTSPTQETVPKVVEPSNSTPNQKSQPTGTVPPTCRPEKGTCSGIPAGYESDDSWGGYSNNDDPQQQTPDLDEELYPLVAYRTWKRPYARPRNTPSGVPRGSHHRAPNRQIPVWDGYEWPQRPWDAQPYGRRTRSQRALQERAYRKWQRRYNQV